MDDKSVTTSRQLKDEIAAKHPGHVTALNVVRARQHLLIKVTVAELPTEAEMAADRRPSRGQSEEVSLGVTVEPMSKHLAKEYGIEDVQGVIVTAVKQDSAAEASGLKDGDIITEVNRKHVTNLGQFREAIKTADAKAGIMINLISDGASRFVVLKDDGK